MYLQLGGFPPACPTMLCIHYLCWCWMQVSYLKPFLFSFCVWLLVGKNVHLRGEWDLQSYACERC